jgi:hypothetical protein
VSQPTFGDLRCVALVAYDASDWHELFVAAAGASAALTGLVFVAVSINVERILKFPGLPERALETVLLLLSVVLVSFIGLIPGQSQTALGLELLGEGLVFGAAIGLLATHSVPERSRPSRAAQIVRQFLLIAGTVPLILGGASLLADTGGGLYWTAAGMVFAMAGGVGNAWVLLVEILR